MSADDTIAEINRVLNEVWERERANVSAMYLSLGQLTWIARQSMTKRRFRRWRGKMREQLRTDARWPDEQPWAEIVR